MPGASTEFIIKIKAQGVQIIRHVREELEKAQEAAGKHGKKVASATDVAARSTDNLVKKLIGLATAYIAVGKAINYASKLMEASIEYQQELAKAASVAGATTEELQAMSEQALLLARYTRFTARESADAFYSLASAGFTASESIQALTDTMLLAGATGETVGDAAERVTAVMRAFGMQTAETARVTNLMAQVIATSPATLERLGFSFKYTAGLASTLGWTIEELAAAIGLLHRAGFFGEMAGVALRAALVRLFRPMRMTQEGLKLLGLTADQVNPAIHSLADILDLFRQKLGYDQEFKNLEERTTALSRGLQALTKIVGQEALPAFLALVVQGGKAVREYTDLLTGTQKAQEQYIQMMDTINSQWKIVQSAMTVAAYRALEPFSEAAKRLFRSITTGIDVLAQALRANAKELSDFAMLAGDAITTAAVRFAQWSHSLVRTSKQAVSNFKPLLTGIQDVVGAVASAFAKLVNMVNALPGPLAALGLLGMFLVGRSGKGKLAFAAFALLNTINEIISKMYLASRGFGETSDAAKRLADMLGIADRAAQRFLTSLGDTVATLALFAAGGFVLGQGPGALAGILAGMAVQAGKLAINFAKAAGEAERLAEVQRIFTVRAPVAPGQKHPAGEPVYVPRIAGLEHRLSLSVEDVALSDQGKETLRKKLAQIITDYLNGKPVPIEGTFELEGFEIPNRELVVEALEQLAETIALQQADSPQAQAKRQLGYAWVRDSLKLLGYEIPETAEEAAKRIDAGMDLVTTAIDDASSTLSQMTAKLRQEWLLSQQVPFTTLLKRDLETLMPSEVVGAEIAADITNRVRAAARRLTAESEKARAMWSEALAKGLDPYSDKDIQEQLKRLEAAKQAYNREYARSEQEFYRELERSIEKNRDQLDLLLEKGEIPGELYKQRREQLEKFAKALEDPGFRFQLWTSLVPFPKDAKEAISGYDPSVIENAVRNTQQQILLARQFGYTAQIASGILDVLKHTGVDMGLAFKLLEEPLREGAGALEDFNIVAQLFPDALYRDREALVKAVEAAKELAQVQLDALFTRMRDEAILAAEAVGLHGDAAREAWAKMQLLKQGVDETSEKYEYWLSLLKQAKEIQDEIDFRQAAAQLVSPEASGAVAATRAQAENLKFMEPGKESERQIDLTANLKIEGDWQQFFEAWENALTAAVRSWEKAFGRMGSIADDYYDKQMESVDAQADAMRKYARERIRDEGKLARRLAEIDRWAGEQKKQIQERAAEEAADRSAEVTLARTRLLDEQIYRYEQLSEQKRLDLKRQAVEQIGLLDTNYVDYRLGQIMLLTKAAEEAGVDSVAIAKWEHDQRMKLIQETLAVHLASYQQTASAMSNLFSAMQGLFAEHTAAHKAFAIASIITNTAAGIMQAFATLPPPAAWVQAAAVAALGAAQLAKVGGSGAPTVGGGPGGGEEEPPSQVLVGGGRGGLTEAAGDVSGELIDALDRLRDTIEDLEAGLQQSIRMVTALVSAPAIYGLNAPRSISPGKAGFDKLGGIAESPASMLTGGLIGGVTGGVGMAATIGISSLLEYLPGLAISGSIGFSWAPILAMAVAGALAEPLENLFDNIGLKFIGNIFGSFNKYNNKVGEFLLGGKTKVKTQELRGTLDFGAEDFSGYYYTKTKTKKGVLRGGGTKTREYRDALDASVDDALDHIVQRTGEMFEALGEVFGFNADALLEDFAYQFRVNVKGKTSEEIAQALSEEVGDAINEAAEHIFRELGASLTEFAQEGEEQIQTMIRLATEVAAVDAMVRQMGTSLQDLVRSGSALDRIRWAGELVQLSGGLDNFQQSIESFLQGLYDDIDLARLNLESAHTGLAEMMRNTHAQIKDSTNRSYVDLLTLADALDQGQLSLEQAQVKFRDLLDTIQRTGGFSDPEALEAFLNLGSALAAAKDAQEEYNDELEDFRDVIAQHELTEYRYELQRIQERHESLLDTLVKGTEEYALVAEAYQAALAELEEDRLARIKDRMSSVYDTLASARPMGEYLRNLEKVREKYEELRQELRDLEAGHEELNKTYDAERREVEKLRRERAKQLRDLLQPWVDAMWRLNGPAGELASSLASLSRQAQDAIEQLRMAGASTQEIARVQESYEAQRADIIRQYTEQILEEQKQQYQDYLDDLKEMAGGYSDVFETIQGFIENLVGERQFQLMRASSLREQLLAGPRPEDDNEQIYLSTLQQYLELYLEHLQEQTDAIKDTAEEMRDLRLELADTIRSLFLDEKLAPAVSREGYEKEFERLYQAAAAEDATPEAIREFVDFTKSKYLPFMRTYLGTAEGAYQEVFDAVIDKLREVGGLDEDLELSTDPMLEAQKEIYELQRQSYADILDLLGTIRGLVERPEWVDELIQPFEAMDAFAEDAIQLIEAQEVLSDTAFQEGMLDLAQLLGFHVNELGLLLGSNLGMLQEYFPIYDADLKKLQAILLGTPDALAAVTEATSQTLDVMAQTVASSPEALANALSTSIQSLESVTGEPIEELQAGLQADLAWLADIAADQPEALARLLSQDLSTISATFHSDLTVLGGVLKAYGDRLGGEVGAALRDMGSVMVSLGSGLEAQLEALGFDMGLELSALAPLLRDIGAAVRKDLPTALAQFGISQEDLAAALGVPISDLESVFGAALEGLGILLSGDLKLISDRFGSDLTTLRAALAGDLDAVAQLLGMELSDLKNAITVLGAGLRLGIDTGTEEISNRLAQLGDIQLAGLEDVAEQLGISIGDVLDVLDATAEDFSRTVGSFVLSAIDTANVRLEDVAEALGMTASEAAAALESSADVWGAAFASTQDVLNASVASIAQVLGLSTDEVAQVLLGVTSSLAEELSNLTTATVTNIGSAVGRTDEQLREALDASASRWSGYFSSASDLLKTNIFEVADTLGVSVQEVGTMLGLSATELESAVGRVVQLAATTTNTTLMEMLGSVGSLANTLGQSLDSLVTTLILRVGGTADSFTEGMRNLSQMLDGTIGDLATYVGMTVDELVAAIDEQVPGAAEAFKNAGLTASSAVTNALTVMGASLSTLLQTLASTAEDTIAETASDLANVLVRLQSALAGSVDGTLTTVDRTTQAILNALGLFSNDFSGLVSNLNGDLAETVDGLSDLYDSTGTLSDAVDDLTARLSPLAGFTTLIEKSANNPFVWIIAAIERAAEEIVSSGQATDIQQQIASLEQQKQQLQAQYDEMTRRKEELIAERDRIKAEATVKETRYRTVTKVQPGRAATEAEIAKAKKLINTYSLRMLEEMAHLGPAYVAAYRTKLRTGGWNTSTFQRFFRMQTRRRVSERKAYTVNVFKPTEEQQARLDEINEELARVNENLATEGAALKDTIAGIDTALDELRQALDSISTDLGNWVKDITGANISIPGFATGAWTIPAGNIYGAGRSDGLLSVLHPGEMVVRADDAPYVREFMRATGLSTKYGVPPARIDGIPAFASGTLDVTEAMGASTAAAPIQPPTVTVTYNAPSAKEIGEEVEKHLAKWFQAVVAAEMSSETPLEVTVKLSETALARGMARVTKTDSSFRYALQQALRR